MEGHEMVQAYLKILSYPAVWVVMLAYILILITTWRTMKPWVKALGVFVLVWHFFTIWLDIRRHDF
jgi:threonine/homoserine/homoserine lactone efflux protein